MVSKTLSPHRPFTPAEMTGYDVYLLMSGCIAPRPVVLISTLGPGGIVNAAPYSNFMGVSSQPCLVAFTASRHTNGQEKDTVQNIRETGEFVINAVSEEMAEPMDLCAVDFPRTRSEVEASGLHTVASHAIRTPRIAESPVTMECRVHQILDLGDPETTTALVIGEVLRFHVCEDVIEGGFVSSAGWKPLAGLGGMYATIGRTFMLTRPEIPLEGPDGQ